MYAKLFFAENYDLSVRGVLHFQLRIKSINIDRSFVPFSCADGESASSSFLEQHSRMLSSFMSRKLKSYAKFILRAANRPIEGTPA